VLTAVVVVVVLACRRRRCRLPSKPGCSLPQHTTVVAVSAVPVDPYSEIPPLRTSSTTKDRSDYLSFSPSPDQTPSVSTAATDNPDYIHLPLSSVPPPQSASTTDNPDNPQSNLFTV